MAALPDGALLVDMLPTFYKQRDAHFFPAWAFAAAQLLVRLPWVVADTITWSLMVYFTVGFDSSARFLTFWAICLACALFGLSVFMAIGALCREQSPTSAASSFLLLILVNTVSWSAGGEGAGGGGT